MWDLCHPCLASYWWENLHRSASTHRAPTVSSPELIRWPQKGPSGGEYRERGFSRGCDLWLLAGGLGSEMALDLEERWHQKGNEMGLADSSVAISGSHTFQGVSAE